jgi:hypothetical protein
MAKNNEFKIKGLDDHSQRILNQKGMTMDETARDWIERVYKDDNGRTCYEFKGKKWNNMLGTRD